MVFNRMLIVLMATVMAAAALILPASAGVEAISAFPVQVSFFAKGGFRDGKHMFAHIKRINTGFEKFVDVGKACPQNNHEAAGLIGGEHDRWSKPDSRFNNWVYNDPGKPVRMVMTFFGVLDGWWDGQARSTNVQGEAHDLDIATFKCDS